MILNAKYVPYKHIDGCMLGMSHPSIYIFLIHKSDFKCVNTINCYIVILQRQVKLGSHQKTKKKVIKNRNSGDKQNRLKPLRVIKASDMETSSLFLSPHAFIMKMFICLKRSTNNHFSRQEQEISSQGRFNQQNLVRFNKIKRKTILSRAQGSGRERNRGDWGEVEGGVALRERLEPRGY